MYSSENRMSIFPIVELIEKEVKKIIKNNPQILIKTINGGTAGSGASITTKDQEYIGSILAALESNDYELKLVRNQEDLLHQVIITYTLGFKVIITLFRTGEQLSKVTTDVYSLKPIDVGKTNPFGMSESDYLTYVRYKMQEKYLAYIINNSSSTELEKSDATEELIIVREKMYQIKSMYNIFTESMSLEELLLFCDNPTTMSEEDFISYMWDKWIYTTTDPDVTQELKDTAHAHAESLREKYHILSNTDMYPYTFYMNYIYTPTPMSYQDFVDLVNILYNMTVTVDPERMHWVYLRNVIFDKNYIDIPDYSLYQFEDCKDRLERWNAVKAKSQGTFSKLFTITQVLQYEGEVMVGLTSILN